MTNEEKLARLLPHCDDADELRRVIDGLLAEAREEGRREQTARVAELEGLWQQERTTKGGILQAMIMAGVQIAGQPVGLDTAIEALAERLAQERQRGRSEGLQQAAAKCDRLGAEWLAESRASHDVATFEELGSIRAADKAAAAIRALSPEPLYLAGEVLDAAVKSWTPSVGVEGAVVAADKVLRRLTGKEGEG